MLNLIQQVMGILQKGNNPASLMQNLASQNPNAQKAMQMCMGKSKEDIGQVFLNTARTQGIDVNQFIQGFSKQTGIPIEQIKNELGIK